MRLLEKLCDEAELNFKQSADLVEVQRDLEGVLQKVEDKTLQESIMAACNVYAGTYHEEGVKQGIAIAYSLRTEIENYIENTRKTNKLY